MEKDNKYSDDAMFGSFQENLQPLEENPLHLGSINKPQQPTQLPQLPQYGTYSEILYTSTLQIGQRNYIISIQDSFLEEHQKAFRNSVENFIESALKREKLSFDSEEILGQEPEYSTFKNCEENLNSEGNNKLIQEIKSDDSVEKFITMVFQMFPKKAATEIFTVCSIGIKELQENFLNYKNFQSQIDVVREARKLSQRIHLELFVDKRLETLSLSRVAKTDLQDEESVKNGFKMFLEFILATIILVGSGYFTNPYTGNEQFKRNRSFQFEDDEDFSSSSSDKNRFLGQPKKRTH